MFSVLVSLFVLMTPLYADELNSDIMNVLESSILRGNNNIVATYSGILAWGAQFIITACGFFIIALKTCTIAFTLLYLTHPRFWDSVSNIKQEAKGRAQGGGDWLATIVSWLTPDVRALSEYGQVQGEDAMYDIGGIQTIGTYVRKNAVQFIVLITLASVLWSGKLLILLGRMSQGCEAVIDWALNVDYGGSVKSMLESDRDYQFLFDTSKNEGRNKQKFAKSLYSKVKTAVPDNNTSDFFNDIGTKIQERLNTGELATLDGEGVSSHVKWENPTLTYAITWNPQKPNNTTTGWSKGVYVLLASDVITSTEGQVTATQQTMAKNGVFYITFNAQQTYDKEVESNDGAGNDGADDN
ncbi:MAG: hypothetical protein J6D33_11485 [Turicibacter sp.]|nr:hypothetical protein [Turicibacter sp.]